MRTLRWSTLVLAAIVCGGCVSNAFRNMGPAVLGAGLPKAPRPPWVPRAKEPDRPAAPGEERVFAGIAMVWVPAGTFIMGSPKGEPQRDPEDEIPRPVTIAQGFWISKYEVTQAQWEAVMGENPSEFQGYNRPVENVSWKECREFARRLSARGEGTFRLPAEPEWEYACRAGTETPFSFGGAITTDRANYNGQYRYAGSPRGLYRESTTPVGSFEPNGWGLYDMHGNVWEWCEDQYGETFVAAECPGGAPRVIRGGGWLSEPMSCRSAYSYCFAPNSRHGFVGFRVVRDADEDAILACSDGQATATSSTGERK